MTAQRTVGLVGLGQMGGAMCRTLLRSGWQVVAWDVAPAALAAAVQARAEPADSAAGVGVRAPIVLTSLPDGHVLEAAVLDAGGLADGIAPGSLLVDTPPRSYPQRPAGSPTGSRGARSRFSTRL
jgi:3-hydroxyisobutyrate dehydrogenase-like beta-hydroxyacid dehydrogenase